MATEAAAAHESAHSVPQCDAALSDAFALLGKRWNGMILGSLIEGPAGFSEIRRALQDDQRLGALRPARRADRAGLVLRDVDAGPPVAVRYQLAESGVALIPVLEDLMEWARKNL